jgi:hypothetical protein
VGLLSERQQVRIGEIGRTEELLDDRRGGSPVVGLPDPVKCVDKRLRLSNFRAHSVELYKSLRPRVTGETTSDESRPSSLNDHGKLKAVARRITAFRVLKTRITIPSQ